MELSQWRKFARHPLSEIFPDMEDVSFEAMTADMKERGYDNKQQVLLFEGKVLDGWHRMRAAVISGKTPTFDNYKGNDPLGEVIRRNLTRRHMDASQRAMVAARIVNIKAPGRPSGKTDIGANAPISQGAAAELMSVDRKRVGEAVKVEKDGTPALQQAVVNGTVSVSDAAKIVNEPPKVQNAAVKDVASGKAPTATAAAKKRTRKKKSEPSIVYLCKKCSAAGSPQCKTCKKKDNPVPDPRVTHPAEKPKPAGSNGQPREPGVEDNDETVVDAGGLQVPAHAIEAFVKADEISTICREMDGIIRKVEVIANGPGGRLIRFDSFKQQMKDAKGNLWANRATRVCPYCHGKEKNGKPCECCKGEGWTSELYFKQSPGNNEKAKR